MSSLILPPLTFLTHSLGCRTNQAEMENIGLQLMAYGFKNLCNFETLSRTVWCGALPLCNFPSVILLNTCVVTIKAEKETRQKIRELRKKYPKSFLVVLGCGVDAKNKFAIDLPEADLFISNEEKDCAVNKIIDVVETGHAPSLHKQIVHNIYSNNKYVQSGRKFIKIQDGCDGGCSFCLTQYVRGKPTSVPSEKIINEINFWVENGIKEIILTGVNIGLWENVIARNEVTANRRDPAEAGQSRRVTITRSGLPRFARYSLVPGSARNDITFLLKKILSETKIERISFSSIYPEMLTEEFLTFVVENPRISQCFHLSLQSGSQTVLKRMNRKTNLDELLKKLQRIKEKNPNFTFRADIITGFPEETEKEFQETLDFIKKAKIAFVHHFHFSRRQHTKSEVMIKNKIWKEVLAPIKKQRAERLKKVVEKIKKEEAEKMIGSPNGHQSLIVETGHAPSLQTGNTWEGITENGWPIDIETQSGKVSEKQSYRGKILPIKIIGFEENYLLGEIVDLPTKGIKTSGISTLPSGF